MDDAKPEEAFLQDDYDHHDPNDTSPHDQNDSDLLSPADGAESSTKPLQKRRRVTRACDECRRKKIKCDGKQPCTHCTVYGYECTYDQPSNRRRNAAPHYIEALEKQLSRATAILRLVLPEADLNDPNLEAKLAQGMFRMPETPSTAPSKNGAYNNPQTPPDGGIDSHLESMVRSTGQLDLDEQGNLEYHGHSSGLSFVRRMREQLGDVMGPEGQGTPFVKSRPMSQVFDSPRSTHDSPFDASLVGPELPPKDVARLLCDNAILDAASILRVVHYPTFIKQFDSIFDKPPESYTNDDNVFLPLLYATMALGTLFSKDDDGELDRKGYENAITEGLARQLMDIADCRDLRQVQAVVFMIMFLQSSAKLSTCYAYIGVALRSALRMGLHRSFTDSFDPIESDTRKRVFWVIQRMDTFVGALLGLPHSLSAEDIDQELPAEVDDEYITENGILPMPEGQVSFMAAANAHTKLVQILDKIVHYVYPLKGSGSKTPGRGAKSYSVSYAKILEIEKDLKDWQDELPMALMPGGEATGMIMRVQHLLRMGYAHAQMMLYRPFLHYVSHTCKSRVVDKRSYACAAACVSVSRNIIHIAVEMKKRGLLIGAYWFTMYTTFFAILSLVFYALENPENEASQDVLKVAKEGKETLESLTKRSMAADRCSATLSALFEQLPERISRSRQGSMAARKRKTEPSPHDLNSNSAHGENHTKKDMMLGAALEATPKRANTFPNGSPGMDKAQAYPTTGHSFQGLDTMYPQSSNASFYDPTQLMPVDTESTPSLSSGVSARQESFPASPSTFVEQNFPLADLSAMMFPSADPFAYPNQTAPPAQTYDNLLKNLGDDPSFPFPATLDELRMQRNAGSNTFVPPSSTFMFNNGNGMDGQSNDNDVQLFGPMPAYMMQGGAAPRSNGNPSFGQMQQQYQGGQSQPQQYGNPAANVNLDELLGSEEWAGNGLSSMASVLGPQGPFVPKTTNGQAVMAGQDGVSFESMNPGRLGWDMGYG
ncbi:hypothetical protein E2P81_ATG02756 [Venturia nashicola]|nr:hypothetical protein E2P81_ATG02756 [Venturia nashicola]